MMAAPKRSEYVVEIGGVEHVLLLTEEDAKNYVGAEKKDGAAKAAAEKASKAQAAANKAVQNPSNK
jgi:hypothetical protein